MEFLSELNVVYEWLIVGVVFIALEAFGIPGVGFFFMGIGALATGILLSLDWIGDEQIIVQFAVCFAIALASGVLLWRPIQKLFPSSKTSPGYNDVIGATAIVGAGGLRRGGEGIVLWSGTIMKAELAPDAGVSMLAENTAVTIIAVMGAKLIVSPKS